MAEKVMSNDNEPKKSLSIFQSASIINGCGVGAGILAIPFFANKVGIVLAIILLIFAYLGIYVIHLMIAEVSIRRKKDADIFDFFKTNTSFKFNKKVFTIVLTVLIALTLSCNLASYIVAAAESLSEYIPGLPIWGSKLVFYALAAGVALFGLKVLGVTEKYATIIILASVLSLVIGSCLHLDNVLTTLPSSVKEVFGYTSMCMFAFSAFFSVPQVVEGLNKDRKKIRKSIALGMFFNLLTILVVMIFALLSSKLPIKNPCITSWAAGIGDWAKIVGLIFILIALFSSYWALSYSLRYFVHVLLKIEIKWCWLISTLPSLILSLLIPLFDKNNGFSLFISVSSFLQAVIVVSIVYPRFHNILKQNELGSTVFAKFGNIVTEIFFMIAVAVLFAGSIINIIDEFLSVY